MCIVPRSIHAWNNLTEQQVTCTSPSSVVIDFRAIWLLFSLGLHVICLILLVLFFHHLLVNFITVFLIFLNFHYNAHNFIIYVHCVFIPLPLLCIITCILLMFVFTTRFHLHIPFFCTKCMTPLSLLLFIGTH